MKKTVYDIARKAHVSIATISRAVNPETRHKLKPETLQRIDRIIKELHYVPNTAARHLSTSTFHTLGLVIPHHMGVFFNDYYSKILSGLSDFMFSSKYYFKLIMLKYHEMKWDSYNFKSAEGVDGIIVVHWPYFFSDKDVFGHFDFPCVVINDMIDDAQVHFVCSDNKKGGEMAAEYLLSRGHRNIAVLHGSRWLRDIHIRFEAFSNRLKKEGVILDIELIIDADNDENVAYEKTEELFKKNKKFTALWAMTDSMAIGALRKLREMGIKCPQDVSVMGFDDEQRSGAEGIALTTIRQPVYELAKEAGTMLVKCLEENKNKVKSTSFLRTILPVSLIERNTVRAS